MPSVHRLAPDPHTALVLAAGVALIAAAVTVSAGEPAGPRIYLGRGCQVCHGESLEGTRMGPPLTDAGRHWKRPALRRYLANPDSVRRVDPRLQRLDERYRRFTMPSYEFEDDAFAALARYLLQPR